jgi:hypothetical protein
MFKSVFYKEWLKIRVIVLAIFGVSLITLIYIFLNVRHDILFSGATNYWYSFLFRGIIYFGILKFLPFVAGLGLAIAQYFPETVNKRIKLTFHLPVSENGVLMKMHAIGASVLLLLFTFILILFIAWSSVYFPSEIINASLLTLAPWFMGGMTTYFLLALVMLEPVWLYRGLYTVAGAGLVSLYFSEAFTGAFRPVLTYLALITVLLSFVVLFSAYRFRKGEM